MNAIDVLVVPSRNEGFGSVAIEAQACGCPVVGTKVGSISEAIGSGGITIEPGSDFEDRFFSNNRGSGQFDAYSVAMRLIEVFAFIPMVLKSSLLPAFSKAKVSSENLYQNRLFSFYKLMMIISLMVGLPIFIFGSNIVTFLYGIDYQPAGYLFSLMAIRLFFVNYGVARGVFILNENLFKFSMTTMILGTITNIAFNYMLIPEYQSVGAIWATIIFFFVTIFAIDFLYPKTRHNSILMMKSMIEY